MIKKLKSAIPLLLLYYSSALFADEGLFVNSLEGELGDNEALNILQKYLGLTKDAISEYSSNTADNLQVITYRTKRLQSSEGVCRTQAYRLILDHQGDRVEVNHELDRYLFSLSRCDALKTWKSHGTQYYQDRFLLLLLGRVEDWLMDDSGNKDFREKWEIESLPSFDNLNYLSVSPVDFDKDVPLVDEETKLMISFYTPQLRSNGSAFIQIFKFSLSDDGEIAPINYSADNIQDIDR